MIIICSVAICVHATKPPTIRNIAVYGNKTTKDRVVRHFLEVDSGDVYDTSSLKSAEKRLAGTGLFKEVKVFAYEKATVVDLSVVLIEKPYFMVTDIGGELMVPYGWKRDRFEWWQRGRMRIACSMTNFRGQKEDLSLRMTLIEWRSLSLNWYKPFLGKPYFVKTGIGVGDNPSNSTALRTQSISLGMSAGRKIGTSMSLHAGVGPQYSNTIIIANDPEVIKVDSLSKPIVDTFSRENKEFAFSTVKTGFSASRLSSTKQGAFKGWALSAKAFTNFLFQNDEIKRLNPWYRDSAEYTLNEIAYLNDMGRTFDPERQYELLTRQFFEVNSRFRFFHRGFFKRDYVGYNSEIHLRDWEAGILNRVYAGGPGTLRGYNISEIGARSKANNMLAVSCEYRFPILPVPQIQLPNYSLLGYNFKSILFKVDGALFADGAYLWHKWYKPYSSSHEAAYSAGAGIRFIWPYLHLSGVIDFPFIRADEHYSPTLNNIRYYEFYTNLPF
ncbi:MAG: BamA/TamA family outer membrane protein [Chitinivibrionales bacterium]|nr:BamA/TamA family outer membrane protein [Chitinivibrionales bacterium]